LGTDQLGRDLLIRVLFAARFTLLITVGATGLALALGFVLGSIAAWFGRYVDTAIMSVINVFWSIPFAVFVVLLVAVVGASVPTLILAIGGVNWVTSARVFRAEMLRLRRSDFLRAARANGFAPSAILLKHALPCLRATALGIAGYAAAETVTLESGLAFLGLSIPPPMPTWGGMMAEGLPHLSSGWWAIIVPAVAVTLTLASFRSLASGAEKLFNSR
jgi:ABC-type dipeptide/oligopeptide/nickel transport system permease subunit